MSEWRFHHEGEKFKMKKVDYPSCQGCHFEHSNDECIRITACSICTGKPYQMIFVKDEERETEMACYGDDSFKPFVECSETVREPARPFIDKAIKEAEWDAKFEIFERNYPLIKWAVVAGLLGLVWLVSL